MSTPELAAYVRQARAAGLTDEYITQALANAGWDQRDIGNALTFTPTPEAQAAAVRVKSTSRVMHSIGYLIGRLVLLLEVFLGLRVIGHYVGVEAHHWLAYVVYLPTDWAVVPWQSLTIRFISGDLLFGLSALPLASLLLIPGGSLDVAGLTAAIVYGFIYLILASLVRRLYRALSK